MENSVNISIIIPHYNTPQLLEKLLMTIPIRQDVQVIIIDDYSEKELDYYRNVKEAFCNKCVEFYSNDRTKGAGSCRNIGIEKAEGKWALFADADDFFIQGFYDIMSNYFNEAADIIFFMPTSIFQDTGKVAYRHSYHEKCIKKYINEPINKYNENIIRYTLVEPWSKLVRISLIRNSGILFDEIICSNDVMFSTKIGYNAKQIKVINERVYCVTRADSSLTSNISEEQFLIRFNTFVNRYNYLKNRLVEKEFKELSLNGYYHFIRALLYKYSIKTIKIFLMTLKKNNIPILNFNTSNPLVLLKKFIDSIRKIIRDKKFQHK